VRELWTALYLAQEMGAMLGSGALLLGALSAAKKQVNVETQTGVIVQFLHGGSAPETRFLTL